MVQPSRAIATAALALASLALTAGAAASAPDLTIQKSHAGDFTVGTNGVYSLVVRNLGTSTTLGATTVTDTLPAGLTFLSGNGLGWSASASGQVVTLVRPGLIAAGDTSGVTVTVAVSLPAAPAVVNRAWVSTVADANAANNGASDPTTVNVVDLALTKSHSGDFTVGDPGAYDLRVDNVGTAATFGAITVRDTLPSGLTYVSGGGAGWGFSVSGQTVTAVHPGPIAAGGNLSFTLNVSVGASAVPSVVNRAGVITSGDVDWANNLAFDSTTVHGRPDLWIDKSHTGNFIVGTQDDYTLLLENLGTAATNATTTVLDTLPTGLVFVSGSGAGWTCSAVGQVVTCTRAAPIAAGDTTAIVLRVDVQTAAFPQVVNCAVVSVLDDTDPTNDRDCDTTTVIRGPDLSLNKSHTGMFTVGIDGIYTLTVTNIGSGTTLDQITMVDVLPSGLTYVSASGPGWVCGNLGQVVTCTRTTPILPDDSTAVMLRVAVDASAVPSVSNTATVSTSGDVDPDNNVDSDPTAVTPVNLELTKSHGGSFVSGANGTYSFNVTNVGVAASSGTISVRDTLPAGLSFVSGSGAGWAFAAAGSVVTATRSGPLGAGSSSGFTMTVAVGPQAYPQVTNRATVDNPGDGTPANNRATDPTTVQAADLELSKRHSGDFTVGVPGVYDFTVHNRGNAQTFGTITVTDTLPSGLTFASGSGAGWNFSASGQVVSAWHLGPFAPGDSSTFSMTVSVGNPAVPGVTNTAHVANGGDPLPGNDSASDPTVVHGAPDLAIAKTHSSDFTVGANGTYTLRVDNVGASPTAATITVVDTLPAGLTYVSAGGAGWTVGHNAGVVTATRLAALPAGDSTSFTLTVAVDTLAAPAVVNRAHVSVSGDFNNSNDTASDPTTVNGVVDLEISKSHPGDFSVGANGTYTITVRSVGTVTAANTITVVDTLPAGLGFVSANGAGWSVGANGAVVTATHPGPLSPGAAAAFDLTVFADTAAAPGVTNRAHVSTAGDGNATNDTASDPTVVQATLDLAVSKSHTGSFTAGANGVYTIAVDNVGTAATATTITVRDTLPGGLSFVSGSGAGWAFAASAGVVTATRTAPLAPGQTSAFTLTVAVDSTAVPGVVNAAVVSIPGDANSSNDRDTDPTVVNAQPQPDLALTKSHMGDFTEGINGAYFLTVENQGDAATTGTITVVDTLPAGLSFVSGGGGGWSFAASGSLVTATRGATLPPGQFSAFSLTVAVDSSAVPGVTNRAVVSTPGDNNPVNDLAVDPTTVHPAPRPDLALTKSHSGNFTAGTSDVYTLRVDNLGDAGTGAATTVVDTLPGGLTYFSASGPGWSFAVSGQVVTATHAAAIAAGGSASFALTVAVDSTAVPGVTNSAVVSVPGDDNPANDRADDPTTVHPAPRPDLALSKSHTGNFTAGGNGVYTLRVDNVGTAATSGAVTVVDTLPGGLAFVSGGGAGWSFAASAGVVTATHAGVIGAGGSTSFALTLAVDSTAVPGVTNSAVVSTVGDDNASNDRAVDPTTVDPAPRPDLALTKSHTGNFTAGSNGVYTLRVDNLGAAATSATITVVDTLPAGLGFVSGGGAGWSFAQSGAVVTATHPAPLAAGGSTSFTLTVAVDSTAAPGVTNTAVVSTPGDQNAANDRAVDPTVVDGPPRPDLALHKSHAAPFVVGGAGVYTLTVDHVGSAPTTGAITVTDSLPPGLRFVAGSGAGWSFATSGPVVTALHLGPLAPGGSLAFDLTVAVDSAAAPSALNVAVVRTVGDFNAANDRATDLTTVGFPAAVARELRLAMSASRPDAEVGDVVDFRLEVSNPEPVAVANVLVRDRLPAGFRYQLGTARLDGVAAPDPAGADGRDLEFAIGSLAAGARAVVALRAVVGANSPLGDGVSRGLAVSVTDDVASNPAQVQVRVTDGPFSDRGVIFGKVFLDRDCDDDRVQGAEDVGIPGVRVVLEDGTSTVTDSEGKYHFYGVSPRLHVVRVDERTLPEGASLVPIDARSSNQGTTRFVDLKRGEMHKADFAEGSRSNEVLDAVLARRLRGEVTGPIVDRTDAEAERRLAAQGVLEGRVEIGSLAPGGGALGLRRGDRFETELVDFSARSADGKSVAAGRGALFVEGPLRGGYELTLAADSERDPGERLFRDIQPDEHYPVYGDASVKRYDAQSAGRAFARLSKGESFLQYGDFQTPQSVPAPHLGAYQRSLRGVLQHHESGALRLDTFASRDGTGLVVDEMRGRGVSGPYELSRRDGVVNSERVEIVVRDRNQPARILEIRPQQRYADYDFEPLSGRIVFKRPVASVDDALNPVSVRVTYEAEQGAGDHAVVGAQAGVQLGERLELGGAVVRDENPLDTRDLLSAGAALTIAEGTVLRAEVARSDSGDALGGEAGRIELGHAGARFDVRLHAGASEPEFRNPSARLDAGRIELGAHAAVRLDSATVLRLEGLRSQDERTGGRRDGAEAALERHLDGSTRIELGFRHAEETAAPATAATAGVTPYSTQSVRTRLTTRLPRVARSELFGEFERALEEAAVYRAALGADYRLPERGRLYARQEWISSQAGAFALQGEQRLSTTVLGMDAAFSASGSGFSEYRARDAFSGREAEAAIGLRNRWTLEPGVRLDASFERVSPLRGDAVETATAITGGVEYTAHPRWKGTARVELRDADAGEDLLGSLGLARRLSRDWSALGRVYWSDLGSQRRESGRARLGLAWRQTDTDRWNGLARYEFKREIDAGGGADRRVHVAVGDLNFQPRRGLSLGVHGAGKLAGDESGGVRSDTRSYWVAGRVRVDLGPRWDLGVLGSRLFTSEAGGDRNGLGLEIGRTLADNLRVSGGYNLFRLSDADLTPQHQTDHRAYFGVGFKFDERWFGGGPRGERHEDPHAPPAVAEGPTAAEEKR